MPLVTCPECNRRVSTTANACPGCGTPQARIVQAAIDERSAAVVSAEKDLRDARRRAAEEVEQQLLRSAVFNAAHFQHLRRERRWLGSSLGASIALLFLDLLLTHGVRASSLPVHLVTAAVGGSVVWSVLFAPPVWLYFRCRRPGPDGTDTLESILAAGILSAGGAAALIASELRGGIDAHPKVSAAAAALDAARASLVDVGGNPTTLACSDGGSRGDERAMPLSTTVSHVLLTTWGFGFALFVFVVTLAFLAGDQSGRTNRPAAAAAHSLTAAASTPIASVAEQTPTRKQSPVIEGPLAGSRSPAAERNQVVGVASAPIRKPKLRVNVPQPAAVRPPAAHSTSATSGFEANLERVFGSEARRLEIYRKVFGRLMRATMDAQEAGIGAISEEQQSEIIARGAKEHGVSVADMEALLGEGALKAWPDL